MIPLIYHQKCDSFATEEHAVSVDAEPISASNNCLKCSYRLNQLNAIKSSPSCQAASSQIRVDANQSSINMSSVTAHQSNTKLSWKGQRIKPIYSNLLLLLLSLSCLHPARALMISLRPIHFIKTANFATMAASKINDSTNSVSSDKNDLITNANANENYQASTNKNNSKSPQIPFDQWLDRTTARLLTVPDTTPHSHNQHHTNHNNPPPLGTLTPPDVQLITTLMTSHARRSTLSSAMTVELLLKRVVDEVNAGNTQVGVTTKMYTVAMDGWAKCQRRPVGSGGGRRTLLVHSSSVQGQNVYSTQSGQSGQGNQNGGQSTQSMQYGGIKQKQQIPLGAPAQRAHRIHNTLVTTYKHTHDPLLAPTTVSYNAAINAWSKSYHPHAGEMAELLLSEMMTEWRLGHDRVRPDVVTFTAVIDAWVKCTALAHDYHYESPPPDPHAYSTNYTKFRKEKENYLEWKRGQASKADALTRRAAERAKELLQLMISLSHYDPSTSESSTNESTTSRKCEPSMRPNCYTYSAVMNALAKSCSALRAVSPTTEQNYDPAKEAQDMLEGMIEGYERYKGRVGEVETWKSVYGNNDSMNSNGIGHENSDDSTTHGIGNDSNENDTHEINGEEKWQSPWADSKLPTPHHNPTWFDPRPNELTFPPNTINYNSVLNAWSRASRYDSQAALRAESILLNRMELPQKNGGDGVEPDALSYSLVIHAWLRGCRGFHSNNNGSGRKKTIIFTDQDRINRAMEIVNRMEGWARKNHEKKYKEVEESYEDEIIDEMDDISDEPKEYGSSPSFRVHNKSRHLDVEVYNSILVAFLREQTGDHAANVMRLLDRMEAISVELDMPSVKPNYRSYSVALDVITKNAARTNSSLASYYDDEQPTDGDNNSYNPLYAGRAAESLLSRMLANNYRPDGYTFASVLNTYQRIPNGRLDAALAADGVVRGMESLHLHNRIDDPPDVFHYTMVCACWSRSGEQGVAGERCSEILRHMHDRDKLGFPRTRPNIRTYNAVIDAHAHNGRLLEAEDMLRSMVDAYESSAARSIEGIEDEEIPVRPDSFSFNTIIQQWARSRSPEGGRRAEGVLDLLLKFHHNGNADVRPDDRSFAYIIHHYTKGSGRLAPDAPDRALALLRRLVIMYNEGYKDVLPSNSNRTNPIFAFTSVIDAHSVLRRPDSGIVGDELLENMIKLGRDIEPLRPNTYTYLSVLYAWSSCGTLDAGERATELLERMEHAMELAASEGKESIMRTTQRCYVLAQTAWARSPSEKKAEGAFKVLEMMERNYANGNKEAKPTVQAYSMVINACAFADLVTDADGNTVKASPEVQLKSFHIADLMMNRLSKHHDGLEPTSMTFGTFIKCCGRLDLPNDLATESAIRAFGECCRAGLVSDFVLTQMRYALTPEQFLDVLVKNGHEKWDSTGKLLSRDGKRMHRVRWNHLPASWRKNVEPR